MISLDPRSAVPGGQTISSLRRRILLGLLAERELERLGSSVTREELDAMSRWFRTSFSLPRRSDLVAFLRFADLDVRDYSMQMRTYCAVERLLDHHRATLDTRLDGHLAFESLAEWGQGGRDG